MAVYGYARVSTIRQETEGESLDVQRRQIEGYALMHGMSLTEVLVEGGVSGSVPVEERPVGGALFAKAQRGDIIIAAKLDRLFRSALDALKVVESLKTRGVKLHLLDLGGDIAGNGISKLFLTIAAAFAEAERDRIRERISQVKADQKSRGRFLGGTVPFGFRRGDDGELLPHEAEQEAIREMISLYGQGSSLRAIAADMKAKGHNISHEGVAGVLRAKAPGFSEAECLEWRHRNASLRGEIERALPEAPPKVRDMVSRIAVELPTPGEQPELDYLKLVHASLLKRRRALEAAGVLKTSA